MNRTFRRLSRGELSEALALCARVFREFEAPDYTPAGTAAFLQFLEPVEMARMVASGLLTFFGCFEGNRLIGVGATRLGRHISLLFVEGAFHRQGVGTALLAQMEDFCRKTGATECTVNASPFAVPFYHARGFSDLAPETCVDGIRFTSMRHLLLSR